MPLVAFTCSCKTLFGRYIALDKGEELKAVCPQCNAEVTNFTLPHGEGLTTSHLRLPNDQYDYVSPVDGSHISSKRKHRDHLKRHNLIELGNEKPELGKFKASIPRESLRAEMRNQLERMKSDGSWRER